jgi:hypothetical protein
MDYANNTLNIIIDMNASFIVNRYKIIQDKGKRRTERRFTCNHRVQIGIEWLKKSLKIPKGNQKPYIEEEQTTQWSKEKAQKDK